MLLNAVLCRLHRTCVSRRKAMGVKGDSSDDSGTYVRNYMAFGNKCAVPRAIIDQVLF